MNKLNQAVTELTLILSRPLSEGAEAGGTNSFWYGSFGKTASEKKTKILFK